MSKRYEVRVKVDGWVEIVAPWGEVLDEYAPGFADQAGTVAAQLTQAWKEGYQAGRRSGKPILVMCRWPWSTPSQKALSCRN